MENLPPVEPMPLSTAIRLGSMLKPQNFGSFYGHDGTGRVASSCALGAAVDAVGGVAQKVFSLFPILWSLNKLACPAGCEWPKNTPLVAHLNDHHRWSRERIASWIEEIENEKVSNANQSEVQPVRQEDGQLLAVDRHD